MTARDRVGILLESPLLTEISTTAESWPYSNTSAFHKQPQSNITIRLYDAQDNLIVEEELILRTVSGEAQYMQGDLE